MNSASGNRGQFGASCDSIMMSGGSRDPQPKRQEGYDETHTQSRTHEKKEQSTPGNPGGCQMTRGHPPWVAFEEAMHYAERLGYLASGVN